MMSTNATLTLEQWQILFHDTMAALLRAQAAVREQFGLFGLLNFLWKCNRDLKALSAKMKAISELPDGILSEEFIQSHIPQVRKLLNSIENLIDMARTKGLTNRTLTSASLESIRLRGEYLANYLESLQMSIDPDVLKAINDGRSQIDSGDFEVMERLF